MSKDLNIGSQRARVRVGNQVISWGESIFAIGGINSTNSLDFQKLSIPGTQLKEAVLPAPIVSIATGLGHGVNVEAYYQFRWNANRLPPVGTYFSVADILGKGRQPLLHRRQRRSPTSGNFGGLDPAADPRRPPPSRLFSGTTRPRRTAGSTASRCTTSRRGSAPGPRALLHELPRQDAGPERCWRTVTTQWTYLENRKLYGVERELPRRELGGRAGSSRTVRRTPSP